MINLSLAPRVGRVLAYAPDRLVYDGYELRDKDIVIRSGEALDLEGVYVLHLFDANTEFRASRYDGGNWDVAVMRDVDELSDEDHFVFSESQFVRQRYWVDGTDEKIVVNNHFSFSEEGYLRLDGYRLAMEDAQ